MLNTSMQQQSHRIADQRQRIAALAQQAQLTRAALDWQDDPASLAARARALHLKPVTRLRFVAMPAQSRHLSKKRSVRVSRSRRAAVQVRAG
jgi:hypothetical protein